MPTDDQGAEERGASPPSGRVHGKAAAPEGVELVELHATAAAIESTWKAPPEVIAAIIEPMVEMLGDAPNYTESKLVIGKAGEPRYTLTVGRLWGKTPHELRREAEADRDALRALVKDFADLDYVSGDCMWCDGYMGGAKSGEPELDRHDDGCPLPEGRKLRG